MTAESYKHLVEINEKRQLITIYRINEGGRHLYTSMTIPNKSWTKDREAVSEFCRVLGENILVDSPQARRLLNI